MLSIEKDMQDMNQQDGEFQMHKMPAWIRSFEVLLIQSLYYNEKEQKETDASIKVLVWWFKDFTSVFCPMYGHETIGGYEKKTIYGWDKNNDGEGGEGC